jgi:anti-repressor protein
MGQSNEVATVSPFDALGTSMRFGTTEDGTPFVVAADFARALDYRDADRALRLLDEEERGTHLVGTSNGRTLAMGVIYEDGIWELIFRSNKPEAKALKKRVKEILAEIRRTGSYSTTASPALPQTYAEALRELAASVEEREQLAQQVATLTPAASSWEQLVAEGGDHLVGDIAKVLKRAGIDTGPTRLYKSMHEFGWVYRTSEKGPWRAKQRAVDAGWLVHRLSTGSHERRNGETRANPPQVRITAKGIAALHAKMSRAALELVVSGEA